MFESLKKKMNEKLDSVKDTLLKKVKDKSEIDKDSLEKIIAEFDKVYPIEEMSSLL